MGFVSYVIHLIDRDDRKESFEKSCRDSQWDLERVIYINTPGNRENPLHDCRQNHGEALLRAQEERRKWFCIFEDDVLLRPNIKETIVNTIRHAPNDAGVILLGCNMVIGTFLHCEYAGHKLFSFERFTGSHAMLFHSKYAHLFSQALLCNETDLVENVISDTLRDNHLKGYIVTPFAADFIRSQKK